MALIQQPEDCTHKSFRRISPAHPRGLLCSQYQDAPAHRDRDPAAHEEASFERSKARYKHMLARNTEGSLKVSHSSANLAQPVCSTDTHSTEAPINSNLSQPGRGILLNTNRSQESNHRRAHCATPGRPHFCASERESCLMLHGEAPRLWCPAACTPDRSTSSACEGTSSLAFPTEAGSTHAAELRPRVYKPRGLFTSKCTKKPRYSGSALRHA